MLEFNQFRHTIRLSQLILIVICLTNTSATAHASWPMDFEAWRSLFPASESVERVMTLTAREVIANSFQSRSRAELESDLKFARSVVQDSMRPPTRNAEILDLISAELNKNGWKAFITGFAFPNIQSIFRLHVEDSNGNKVFDGHIGELGRTSHHVLSYQFEITSIETTRPHETAKFLAAIATKALPELPLAEEIAVVESVIENYLCHGILANIGINTIERQRLRIDGFLDWPGSPVLDRSNQLIPSLTFLPNSIGLIPPFGPKQLNFYFQLYGVATQINFSAHLKPLSISLYASQFYATKSLGPNGPTLSISPYASSVGPNYTMVSRNSSGEPLQKALERGIEELHHDMAGDVDVGAWYGIAHAMAEFGHEGYRSISECQRNLTRDDGSAP